jgi:hypothetical protein
MKKFIYATKKLKEMKRFIYITKKLKEMKKFIYITKKLKEMKKFIYAIVLLAGFQFSQAQEVVNLFFVDAQSNLILLNHLTVTVNLPSNVTDTSILDFPLAVQIKNTGTQDLNENDTLYFTTTFNETALEAVLIFFGTIKVDSSIYAQYLYPIRVNDIKSGMYANRICVEITDIFHNGVWTSVSQTPYCAVTTINSATSLTDVNAFKGVNLYPNPVHDNHLKIENLNEVTDIQIYNITGQLIQHIPAVTGNTTIDVSNLSNGLYILKMQSGKNVRTEKIQIIR